MGKAIPYTRSARAAGVFAALATVGVSQRRSSPPLLVRRLLIIVTLTFALSPAAAAWAGGAAVIRDCTDDGRLQGHYTQRDLRDALSSIPSDVDEYTNCRDIIRRAAFGGAGGGGKGSGGGGNGGGGAPGGEFGGFGGDGGSSAAQLTGDQQKAVQDAAAKGAGAIRFSDGAIVHPGAVTRRAAEVSDVPTPLVIVVLLLAAAALTAAIPGFRARVLSRRDS
jgi:hypothetical protein